MSLRPHYRTVVVGAGPAGIMAARHAAEAGPVLLVERTRLPRRKVCGGLLHEETIRLLSPFGGPPEGILCDPSAVTFRYLDAHRRYAKRCTLRLVNVDRVAFDEWLCTLIPQSVDIAVAHELASFEVDDQGVTVTVRTPAGTRTVRCATLIGADGARSVVRRLLTPRRTARYVTVQEHVRLTGPLEPFFDCIHTRDGVGGDLGYAYIVPKGATAIVGSVMYPGTQHPRRHHERLLAVARTHAPQLGGTVRRECAQAICVRRPTDIAPGAGRVLLAGEAGGFISPTSGEGISYALRTGALAGTAVAVDPPEHALARYTEALAPVLSEIRRKLMWLPVIESGVMRSLAACMPERLVDRITVGL